jgi:hypothetical protein
MLQLATARKQEINKCHEASMPKPDINPYAAAKNKLHAILTGAVIAAFIGYGVLCAQFGLLLGSLITAGFCALLIPIAIFTVRKRASLEQAFMRKMLNVKDIESGDEFVNEFKIFATIDGLQLFVKSIYPRFENTKFVRVISTDVPNGILYEIKSYLFDEEHCAESMELQVANQEPLSKAWDKKFRNKLILDPKLDLKIAFNPKSDS